MALILVRATTHLPADSFGRSPAPGHVFYADTDDSFVATQLSVGHLVPVGPIPAIDDERGDDS